MRIEKIRTEKVQGRGRVAADVMWEDRDAPAETLFSETSEEFASGLEPSPDAFLLALMPIAQWQGETRILIEGSICCRLRDGLAAAMEIFGQWYERCGPLRIEPTEGFAPTVPRQSSRTGSFLSGGIDAFSVLRRNRIDYPSTHPGFIRDCIMLHGVNRFDHDATGPRPERIEAFESYVRRMRSVADQEHVSLIPVYTNIRTFYPHPTWSMIGFGAGISNTALSLAKRIDRVELASAGLGMRHKSEGSHPSLDHHYSTEAVHVHHAQTALSRLDKLRMVSDWPAAMAVLRPCFLNRLPENELNCGECEKCVRTMLGLVAIGKLRHAPTLPFDDVTPEMLEPVWIDSVNTLPFYMDCVELLRSRGRSDLVTIILKKADAYRRWQRRQKILSFLKQSA